MEFTLILAIIFAFSTIQSVAGVGILLFGTPSLLLLGYDFETTLAVLLPASITISAYQLFGCREKIAGFSKDFASYSLIPTILGLIFVLIYPQNFNLGLIIGILLLSFALLRIFPRAQKMMLHLVAGYKKLFLFSMGLLHGVSNMGGGPLAIYASSNSTNKEKIKYQIALAYLIWGSLQYAVVVIKNPGNISWNTLAIMTISILTYHFIGKRLFKAISDQYFQHLISAMIFCYGIFLLIKSI